LVTQLGGTVLYESLIDDIAYHGFLVAMPAAGVAQFLAGDAPPLLKSDRVMFFRPHGQSVAPLEVAAERASVLGTPTQRTDGTPVVALLDGLPLSNHPLLQGRVIVDDPDAWSENYPAAERFHGTAMASLIALGDLGASGAPLVRPIYARPIMRPAGPARSREERTPDDRLLIDLVHVAVRRMFEAEPGRPAAAPDVRVIDLSVGDPHRLFMGELSPWARLLDWLQHKHNVLFIVSARPARPPAVADTVAQQQCLEPVAPVSLLAHRVLARSHQVTHRFVHRVGHTHHRQITRARQARQQHRVAPVGLDSIARRSRVSTTAPPLRSAGPVRSGGATRRTRKAPLRTRCAAAVRG
jgi:hypothetical protein